MYKIILSLFLAISFLNAKVDFTKKEQEYLKSHQIITVHNEMDWAPYNYNIDGKPAGFSIEYMKLLASKANIKIKFISGPSWDKFLELIKQGKLDVMLNIAKTKEREKFLNYTTTYIQAVDSLVAKKNENFKKLIDLNSKTIGIVKGFYEETLLKEYYPDINVKTYSTTLEALKALSFGHIDAAIDNIGVVNYFINKYRMTDIKPLFEIDDVKFNLDLYMATNKNNTILRDILNKAKEQITPQEILELQKKWLGKINTQDALQLTKKEKTYLKQKKQINMCIDPDWMPYEGFNKQGEYAGISKEFYGEFSKILNTNIQVVKTKDWAQTLEFAKQRKCDIISLAMATPNLKKYMNFTSTFLDIPSVIATKSDVTYINDIKDLNGKKIGMVKGYEFNELLRKKYPHLNIVDVKNINDGLQKVANGEIFGFIDTIISIGYKLQTSHYGDIKISGTLNDNWKISIAVRKDSPELLSIFNKVIKNLDEKKKQDILKRWISFKIEKKVDYQYLTTVVIVFIIFILFALFWIKKLSKVNERSKQLQLQLQKQTDYLENFFLTRAFGILIVDKDRNIIDVNPTLCKIWQYDKSELIGKSASYLHINNETYKEFGKIAFQKVQEKKSIDIEYQLKKKDGTVFWAVFSGEKMKSSDDVLWVIKDIADLKIATQKLSKQKILLEAINKELDTMRDSIMEGIAIFQDSKCIDANQVTLDIFGYKNKEEVVGMNVFDFLNPNSYEKTKKVIEQNRLEVYEADAIKKDGTTFPIAIKAFTLQTEYRTIRIVSVLDLSEMKQKQKALIEAKQKAEEATKLKSEFLANMSHEIRTPMNGIIGMSHLALQTDLNLKQKEYISQIQENSKNLLNIINDILDFSKIEAGKLTIDKVNFNMSDLLSQVKSLIEYKASEKGIEFYTSCECKDNSVFYGDNLRISQIIINLVNNGIKFTHKGFVKVFVSHRQNNIVRFEVVDSGIGISKENQKKLFQSFSQADGSTTRKYGGTGLGLAISKQLVKLMDGKIWVESSEGVGSKFIFELPLEQGDKTLVIKKQIIDDIDIAVLKGSNILLVEDNATNQEIVVGLLQNSGIKIDIANNGIEAIDMFNANSTKYELILMDLQMPIMGGIEATKNIREKNKDIPIVALTANAMKEDTEQTKLAGMNEHLNKPIEVDKLYAALLKFISKKVTVSEVKTEKREIELPKFANIDTTIGLSHMANNYKLYVKILSDFKQNYKDIKLEELNSEDLKRVAHTTKSLSANIGADSLSKVAKEIEMSLDKNLFAKFYEELHKVLKDLDKLNIDNEKDKNLIELTNRKKVELFSSLKEFASKRRARECKKIIDKLKNHKLTHELKDIIIKLEGFINSRDYKSIMEIL